MVKKREPKKAVKKTKEVKVLDTLTSQDLKDLEVTGAEILQYKAELALQEQVVRNIALSIKLLEHELNQEKIKRAELNNKYINKNKSRTIFINEILSKYGLKDVSEFKYNPDTGDIIRD